MQQRHGELKSYQIGDDLIFMERGGATDDEIMALRVERVGSLTSLVFAPASLFALDSLSPSGPAAAKPLVTYGRMFQQPRLPEYRPPAEALADLGNAMAKAPGEGEADSPLPAGYTYLGQFIDHDLSFDINGNETTAAVLEGGTTAPELVISARTASLDLDSIYGAGPGGDAGLAAHQRMYEEDGVSFRVGETTRDKDGGVEETFPNDLPRGADPKGPLASKAIIPDQRNDQNLPVAQTHVAFLKFHNAVAGHLSHKYSGDELFRQTRELVVRYYQWIVLRDFLPRIIDKDVLEKVIEKGPRHCRPEPDGKFLIPFEFAFAAYRLGHSLVRDAYDWNRAQSRLGSPTPLVTLFTQVGFPNASLQANRQLLSAWIIDWRRFFDFGGYAGVKPAAVNLSRKIDPTISAPLLNLPFLGHPHQRHNSLAVVNLLRGRLIGLPAGQSVAERLSIEKPLTSGQIADGRHREILERHGLHVLTPLWYYILREGEVLGRGERLGPVGSHIVAETFVSAIKNSAISILPTNTNGAPVWKPSDDPLDPEKEDLGQFSMSDLLYFVQRSTKGEFLNPVG